MTATGKAAIANTGDDGGRLYAVAVKGVGCVYLTFQTSKDLYDTYSIMSFHWVGGVLI